LENSRAAAKESVKLGKLAKTLRRDLTANPLKAGVLGVLLLGGLYFWGPLVWKWVGKKNSDQPVAAAADPEQTPLAHDASLQSGQRAATKQEIGITWREIQDRRAKDPASHSAIFRQEWNHIFQTAIAAPAPAEGTNQTRTEQFDEDPNKLGLLLEGVAIGSSSKRAVINGKVYRELDIITVKRTPTHPEMKYRLVRVARKTVELEHGGHRWPLSLVSPKADKQDAQAQTPAPATTSEETDK
jgi:hypothetical protein